MSYQSLSDGFWMGVDAEELAALYPPAVRIMAPYIAAEAARLDGRMPDDAQYSAEIIDRTVDAVMRYMGYADGPAGWPGGADNMAGPWFSLREVVRILLVSDLRRLRGQRRERRRY